MKDNEHLYEFAASSSAFGELNKNVKVDSVNWLVIYKKVEDSILMLLVSSVSHGITLPCVTLSISDDLVEKVNNYLGVRFRYDALTLNASFVENEIVQNLYVMNLSDDDIIPLQNHINHIRPSSILGAIAVNPNMPIIDLVRKDDKMGVNMQLHLLALINKLKSDL